MKVPSTKVVFLFKDTDGLGPAIADALHPNHNNSSSLKREEEPFELSLESYGIKDRKAAGDLVHFVDREGNYHVSLVLLEKYEPPILACALNEVLMEIKVGASSELPTLIVPFAGPSSKLKWENKDSLTSDSKVVLYGVQVGAETSTTRDIAAKTRKPSPLLQIHYEPIACLLRLVCLLKLPTSILIARGMRSLSDKALGEDMELVGEIGDFLANTTSLSFSREKLRCDPRTTLRSDTESWRALYG